MIAIKFPFLFACIFVFALLGNAQTIRFFVDPNGRDNESGTIGRPFRTLERALSQSSHLSGKDVLIYLRSGTFYLDTTIRIRAGSFLPKKICIEAYQNEQVFISGGKKLFLHWKTFKNGIYQASVPNNVAFERLYINGSLEVLARYPNYDSAARVFHGTDEQALSPERIRHWRDPVGGYVHALHAAEWGSVHYRIKGVNHDGTLRLEGGWQNNRPGDMHAQYRFVENIFEELDDPHEWWLDRTNNILYYYPPANIDLDSATVEVSQLKNSIELRGDTNQPVRHVQLKGLRFIHNERSFWDTREPLVRSDWTIYRGGAVVLDGTENCSVTGCDFTGLGGNAVMISNYSVADTVSGCHISYIGASAVAIIGDPKALRSPSFNYDDQKSYDQLDTIAGPLTSNYPRACVVTDNLMHDLGQIEKQATGVEIDMSSCITVSHNSIYNTPRAGINIGDGAFGGHILEFNDVFNTVLETGDHGSFNSWGRDRYWSPVREYMDSLVAVHPELILSDAQKQTIIRNNRFRCDHGWDIDLDDGSSNYAIYNNLCLHGGLKLREGFYRIVENNILINNSFHPHVWFKNSGDVFNRNIVLTRYFPIQMDDWGRMVDQNLFADTSDLHASRRNGTDQHSIAGGAGFLDPASGDFRVAERSPARKLGFKNFPMDLFGVQKPSLKKVALRPSIPAILTAVGKDKQPAVVDFFGDSIRSVHGLQDRSAFGLSGEKGVIVVSVNSGVLAKAGLMRNDVIVSVEESAVENSDDFLRQYHSLSWKSQFEVTVIRNQQKMILQINTMHQ